MNKRKRKKNRYKGLLSGFSDRCVNWCELLTTLCTAHCLVLVTCCVKLVLYCILMNSNPKKVFFDIKNSIC